MIKKILKTVIIILIVVILAFSGMVTMFKLGRNADFKAQEARVKNLRNIDYVNVAVPDGLLADGLRINEISYLATHNSYHRQAGLMQLLIIDLAQPGEAEKLRYSHEPLFRQLDTGVRSFEFDLRYRRGTFENTHVPLIDNRSHSPSLDTALDELKIWSDMHPEHIPVIILVEHKDDWAFLDPFLKKWTTESIEKLDRLFMDMLGDRLITPADIKKEEDSVREGLMKYGWPELGISRGKFIIVYHEPGGDYFTEEYLSGNDRAAFIMTSPGNSEAAFILRNDPCDKDIAELAGKGYIVRTRADADCIKDEKRKMAALTSGARIISTDYPKGYSANSLYSLGWYELYM